EVLYEALGRAMQKAGGYLYTPEEESFAAELRKSFDEIRKRPGPETVLVDKSTLPGMASTDVGDVSWNVPLAHFNAATYVPGVPAHSWQAAACAGMSIGRKGMLVAARTLSLAAIELFENPIELEAAHQAFEKQRAGRKWTTRIAPDSKPRLDYAMK